MSQNQNESDAVDPRLEDATEESPLLHSGRSPVQKPDTRPATALINQGSWRRMAGVFLMMVVSYLVIGSIVSYKRLSLPAAKSVADAVGPHDFSSEWAWQHLEQIAQKPHPINSHENIRVREYLVQTVKELQKEALLKNQTVELGDDNVHLTQTRNYLGNTTRLEYYESSNVLVRVVGTEGRAEGSMTGRPEAIVVDAHYGKYTKVVIMKPWSTRDGFSMRQEWSICHPNWRICFNWRISCQPSCLNQDINWATKNPIPVMVPTDPTCALTCTHPPNKHLCWCSLLVFRLGLDWSWCH